jgi:hypothetical protein
MSLTKASYSMITGAPVNVMDYGAKCDGVTDDTAAVQAAVTYCVDNFKDLYIPGICLLTSSVNIDRVVGGIDSHEYFNIFSDNGGGFYIDTAINMFSSTLTYPSSFYPVSQMINFQNIKFIGKSVTLDQPFLTGAYVLNGDKFLRTKFTSCSFVYVSCLSTTEYVQSIYLYDCNARFWKDDFFKAVTGYDIHVVGGLYEGGRGNGFNIIRATGSRFWALIEGCTGTALLLPSAQGVDICCYFEQNNIDVDCSDPSFFNYGVNIHGSFFASPVSGTSIKWGYGFGQVSEGNVFAGIGVLHTIPASNPGVVPPSYVEINDYAQAPGTLSNIGDVVPSQGYRQKTITDLVLRTVDSSDYSTSLIECVSCRIGKMVTIYFTATMTSTGTNASSPLFISAGLPYLAQLLTPCGQVNLGAAAPVDCILSNTSPTQAKAVSNNIPSNVLGDSFVINGNINYLVNE